MSNTKYNVATGGTPLNLWLPNQIKACLDKMNGILLLTNKDNDKNCVTNDELEMLNIIKTEHIKKVESLKKELQELQEITLN